MSEPLSNIVPQSVQALALDANCMPKGRFSLSQLIGTVNVIDEQELEVEIWIPEPIAWEWAEHIHGDLVQGRRAYAAATATVRGAGLPMEADPDIDEHATVVDVLRGLEKLIDETDCARVIRLADHPSAAVAGIRDQALQLGTGRRKTGEGGKRVTTGAVDSASYRLVQAEAGAAIEDVVLVSADKDVGHHFKSKPRPILVKDLWNVKKALLGLVNGSEEAHNRVKEAIIAEVPSNPHVLESAEVEYSSRSRQLSHVDWDRYLSTELVVSRVMELTEVKDIEVSRSDGYASAEATIILSVDINGVLWDDVDDQLVLDVDYVDSLSGVAQISAMQVGGDWNVSVDHIEIV